jgi:hypothetical protein
MFHQATAIGFEQVINTIGIPVRVAKLDGDLPAVVKTGYRFEQRFKPV